MAKSDSLPTWNLNFLFKSEADPAIGEILAVCESKAKSFEKKYRGKIRKFNAKALKRALHEYELLLCNLSKPIQYASLLHSESAEDPKRGAFLQSMRARYTAVQNRLLFFELELLDFDLKTLSNFSNNKELSGYRHYLQVLSKQKPHKLSEKEERLLADKDRTGGGAMMRLFDEEFAHKMFKVKLGKSVKVLNESDTLAMLYSPVREVRKSAADSLTEGLKEDARRITFIFNTLLEDKLIDDGYRKYPMAETARHLSNETTNEAVEAMCSEIVNSYPLVKRFYNMKRKFLGVKELYDYDRYAPIAKTSKKISFSEAKEAVIESFSSFSKGYGAIAKEFFDKKWIDAAARPGKRGGAFCSFVTPDLHPVVFMNYTGNLRDVFTLAHELGHGIHAYLMRKQTYLNFDTPLTVAETASVFAEMVLFDYLKGKIRSEEELLSMYVSKIENVFATVYRQVSLYRFEQDFHSARRTSGELSTADVNKLWRKRQLEMFQGSVTLTPGYDYWWSYIPHFVHSPFYVYAYAYGELLTLSLYGRYNAEGKPFVGKYLNLLESGGSKTPDELLSPFKIKLSSREFWRGGVEIIHDLVREAERISS